MQTKIPRLFFIGELLDVIGHLVVLTFNGCGNPVLLPANHCDPAIRGNIIRLGGISNAIVLQYG
jgi:hypothetical protein